jgi:fumarylacetoacetase
MIPRLNETHDPKAASWIESANRKASDFPLQNLPFGVFRPTGSNSSHAGVAIGDKLVDLYAAAASGALGELETPVVEACRADSLNPVMALPPGLRSALRRTLFRHLHVSSPLELQARWSRLLVDETEAHMQLPARVGDYTDFYASIHHATNVGCMFRPDNPLLPNYKWVPIGYHGRASSLVVSGTGIPRPQGQIKLGESVPPAYGPTKRLDYELEVGMYVAGGNQAGVPIDISRAEEEIFGICLVNDWSARDIQSWEYQPLGPFLAKSFATTVSPWVVTVEALAPFRTPCFVRAKGDPEPLPYLSSPEDQLYGGLDLTLEVAISSAKMREQNLAPHRLSLGSFRDMYWTFAQLLTHHASNGCHLRPGDLLASGTVSGATPDSRGCLLELTSQGARKIKLPSGEELGFLRPGDEIILRGWCEGAGKTRIGLGQCRGRILT